MASTGAALFVLLVISLCAFSSASIVDGRPRPKNFADEPTVRYDGTPMLTDANGPVNCTWYGFANMLYDKPTTDSCLTVVRKALTNATVNPPARMIPYLYYTLRRLVDPTNNESFCYQGCFNLGETAATPPSADAPTDAPPPATFGVPPSSAFSPAPTLLPGAPPPGMDSAPLGAAVPPASILPPPGAAPELSTPAPVVVPPSPSASIFPPPGVATPPAPVGPVGSSGAFLQPATLLSALVAVVAILVAA